MSASDRPPAARLAGALRWGLAWGLFGALFALTPWGLQLEEHLGLRWLYALRGPVPAPPEAVVVAIDKTSADRLGVPYDTEEWPRALHARLVERLREAGAAVVVFDLLFRDRRDAVSDAAFAAAIRRHGRVLLLEYLEKEQAPLAVDAGAMPRAALLGLVSPLPELARAAAATGPFALPKTGPRVNQFWVLDGNAGGAPTLPALALQLYALDGYPALRGALGAADPTAVGDLPAGAAEVLANGRLRPLVQTLFERYPGGPRVVGAGPLASLYDGAQSRYLNFYGWPRSVRTLGYAEVLERPDAAGLALAGSAVFVGLSSPVQWQQRDHFPTVFSEPDTGLDTSGVEILATAFLNLLHDRSLRPLAGPQLAALLLAWGLVVGGLARALPLSYAALAVLGLAGLWLYGALWLFRGPAVWLPLFVPLLVQSPLALATGTVRRLREVQRERRRLRDAVGFYLPASVVERLDRTGFDPGHEARSVHGVCLNSDAERYTALSEALAPDELASVVNAYYARIFAPVREHGGTVSDVVGDAMLSLWASAVPNAADRRAACAAALAIIADDGATPGAARTPPLATRIGLHCGPLVLTHVGARDHFEYRAVGDVVNVSARLQALNKVLGTRLLASEAVVEGLDDLAFRRVGCFVLRGKSRPLEVVEPLGWGAPPLALRRRCERFAAALRRFEAGDWHAAQQAFAALHADTGDGPAAFYGRLCMQYCQRPPANGPGRVVDPG